MLAFGTHWRNLATVDRSIRRGELPNSITLSERLHVSGRTVFRYFVFLRESLGAPLEYDREQNGFRYRRDWDFGRALLRWLKAAGCERRIPGRKVFEE